VDTGLRDNAARTESAHVVIDYPSETLHAPRQRQRQSSRGRVTVHPEARPFRRRARPRKFAKRGFGKPRAESPTASGVLMRQVRGRAILRQEALLGKATAMRRPRLCDAPRPRATGVGDRRRARFRAREDVVRKAPLPPRGERRIQSRRPCPRSGIANARSPRGVRIAITRRGASPSRSRVRLLA